MNNAGDIHRVATVSVVIPTRRRSQSLRRTLQSLEQQADRDFEVVVVFDGPDPDTQALAEEFRSSYPLRWEAHPENRGQGAARNTGVAAARGDWVVFLDDDTVPAADWLAGHRRRYTAPDVVVLGKLENLYPEPARSATETFVRRLNGEWFAQLWCKLERMEATVEREFWVGLNTSISRRAYLEVGGCDPALPVQEDANLAARLLQRGFKFIFDPNILVYHHESKDVIADRAIRAVEFGGTDVYRARNENAAWALSPTLLSLTEEGPLLERCRQRFCWYFPRTARLMAEACRISAEALKSELLLKIWAVLSFSAGYWQGVRSQGIATIAELRKLIEVIRKTSAEGCESGSSLERSRQAREAPATITIAICTRDHAESLRRLLAGLVHLRRPGVDILVVDNAPGNDAARVAAREFGVSYVAEPVPGLSAARNCALSVATGEVIAFVDDDCELAPGWLEAILGGFRDPAVACVTGAVLPMKQANAVQRAYESYGHYFSASGFDITRQQVGWNVQRAMIGVGANMAFRRDALLRAGGFPRFPLTSSGEDDYVFFKLIDAGHKLRYAPACRVYQCHREQMGAQLVRLRQYGRDEMRVLWALAAEKHSVAFFLLNAVFAFKGSVRRLAGSLLRGRWRHLAFEGWHLGGLLTGLLRPALARPEHNRQRAAIGGAGATR